jgi:hypothetical protein
LDKSVVREALRATQRLQIGQPLPERQFFSFAAIDRLFALEIAACITEQLRHILLHPPAVSVAQAFLPHLHVLAPGKYCRRWARRLREEGFSPEDALIVSHASFGMDAALGTFGAEVVMTTDYALKARFERQFPQIRLRFERMVRQLGLPYRGARLPALLRPDELLDILEG